MKLRVALLVGVLAMGVGACGSGSQGESASDDPDVTTTTLADVADVGDSGYLRSVVSGKLRGSTMVPTGSGLLVIGGYADAYEAPISPVDDAAIVHDDGKVTVVPPPPGDPIAGASGSSFDGAAYLVGTRCRSGHLNGDTSALDCKPGDPVLFRLDLASSAWSELALPKDAPAPGGFLGDQAVYALDGALVYQVEDDIGPGGRPRSWFSDDDGQSWSAMPPEPAGAFCAADGTLLFVETGDEPLASGDDPVVRATDDADTDLAMTVRTFDVEKAKWGAASASPDAPSVVSGATSISCVPDVGAAAFTSTGGTSGAVVVYSVKEGWNIVQDAEAARMLSALPSVGSGILVPQMDRDELVRIDGSGSRSTVTLPGSSQAIAGIGDSVLIRTANGDPAVVPG